MSRKRRRLQRAHGRILGVETKTRGSALDEDAVAAATTLVVADAGDFDEDGGWLTINGQLVEYTAVDDDEGTISLATGLDAAAEDGDAVHVWSTLYEEVVEYQVATVELDGERDNPEQVEAEVSELIGDLPEGDRGGPGESCTLQLIEDGDGDPDSDEWEVVAVGGRSRKSKSIRFEADDTYVLSSFDVAAGTATMPLSHRPIDESLVAVWAGVPQRPTHYTVNYDELTITWPLSGFEQAGDRIWVHYAYRRGVITGVVQDETATWQPVQFVSADARRGSTGIELNYGSNVQVGDLMIVAAVTAVAATNLGPGSGTWTPIGTDITQPVVSNPTYADRGLLVRGWWRRITSADVAATDKTVTFVASDVLAGALLVMRGADIGTVQSATGRTPTSGNNSGVALPEITVSKAGARVSTFLLATSQADGNATCSIPNQVAANTPTASYAGVAAGHVAMTDGGTLASDNGTVSDDNAAWAAMRIAVEPNVPLSSPG